MAWLGFGSWEKLWVCWPPRSQCSEASRWDGMVPIAAGTEYEFSKPRFGTWERLIAKEAWEAVFSFKVRGGLLRKSTCLWKYGLIVLLFFLSKFSWSKGWVWPAGYFDRSGLTVDSYECSASRPEKAGVKTPSCPCPRVILTSCLGEPEPVWGPYMRSKLMELLLGIAAPTFWCRCSSSRS